MTSISHESGNYSPNQEGPNYRVVILLLLLMLAAFGYGVHQYIGAMGALPPTLEQVATVPADLAVSGNGFPADVLTPIPPLQSPLETGENFVQPPADFATPNVVGLEGFSLGVPELPPIVTQITAGNLASSEYSPPLYHSPEVAQVDAALGEVMERARNEHPPEAFAATLTQAQAVIDVLLDDQIPPEAIMAHVHPAYIEGVANLPHLNETGETSPSSLALFNALILRAHLNRLAPNGVNYSPTSPMTEFDPRLQILESNLEKLAFEGPFLRFIHDYHPARPTDLLLGFPITFQPTDDLHIPSIVDIQGRWQAVEHQTYVFMEPYADLMQILTRESQVVTPEVQQAIGDAWDKYLVRIIDLRDRYSNRTHLQHEEQLAYQDLHAAISQIFAELPPTAYAQWLTEQETRQAAYTTLFLMKQANEMTLPDDKIDQYTHTLDNIIDALEVGDMARYRDLQHYLYDLTKQSYLNPDGTLKLSYFISPEALAELDPATRQALINHQRNQDSLAAQIPPISNPSEVIKTTSV